VVAPGGTGTPTLLPIVIEALPHFMSVEFSLVAPLRVSSTAWVMIDTVPHTLVVVVQVVIPAEAFNCSGDIEAQPVSATNVSSRNAFSFIVSPF
jgi:hypothetical protein